LLLFGSVVHPQLLFLLRVPTAMRPVLTRYSCFRCASCTQTVTWWSTVRHVLPPVAVAAGRVEGGAGSALGVVGEAVGTLDEVGAVRGVRVQPVVPFLAERCQCVWRKGALIRLPG